RRQHTRPRSLHRVFASCTPLALAGMFLQMLVRNEKRRLTVMQAGANAISAAWMILISERDTAKRPVVGEVFRDRWIEVPIGACDRASERQRARCGSIGDRRGAGGGLKASGVEV